MIHDYNKYNESGQSRPMYESPMSSFSEANAFIPESLVFYLNTSSGPLAFPPSAPRFKIFNDSKYTSVNSVSQ